MKISIRISILSLFMTLLICVGLAITLINYSSSHKLLLTTTITNLKSLGKTTEEHINNLLAPTKYRLTLGSTLISKKIVVPGSSKQFTDFLLSMLLDIKQNMVVAWSYPNGNYYEIERESDNTFYHTSIECTKNICQAVKRHINEKNTLLGPVQKAQWLKSNAKILSGTFTPYDPTKRAWWQQVLKLNTMFITDVYLSISFNQPNTLAIKYVNPIYDANGSLFGTLAFNMSLTTLSNFIAKEKISPHSFTYIFDVDEHNHLIASPNLQNTTLQTEPKIDQINIPWVTTSWQIYHQSQLPFFYFTHNGEKFLSFYDKLTTLDNLNWIIGITLPANDLIGPLNYQIMISLGITTLVLLLGMLIVSLISHAISKPIIKLADETRPVKQLELISLSKINSHIKEIIYLQSAFNAMTKSLRSFAHYLPVALVKQLIASGDQAHVGGHNKNLTFLFSDITGFTSISEKMQPIELMQYLSKYFAAMTKIILEHKGTIDKYIGDGIMSFWGAPINDAKHAHNACKAALKMLEAINILNEHWQLNNSPTITVRIGINTGNAIVGNVGSEDHLSYTAIGDSVNLANRIEEINKIYKTNIIVSDTTYQQTKDDFNYRLLDYVAVRGRNKGVYIYELLPENHKFGANLAKFNTEFTAAFAHYQKRHWNKALNLLQQIAITYPNDLIVAMLLSRCEHFKHNPPEKNWNGIWRFTDSPIETV